MYDPLKNRYEPPWPIRSDPKPFLSKITNTTYQFKSDNLKSGFKVDRVSDGTTL